MIYISIVAIILSGISLWFSLRCLDIFKDVMPKVDLVMQAFIASKNVDKD